MKEQDSSFKPLQTETDRKMSIVSLNSNLDLSGSECLNISDEHTLEACLTVSCPINIVFIVTNNLPLI